MCVRSKEKYVPVFLRPDNVAMAMRASSGCACTGIALLMAFDTLYRMSWRAGNIPKEHCLSIGVRRQTPLLIIDLYTVSPACIDEFIVLLNTKLIESAILLMLIW